MELNFMFPEFWLKARNGPRKQVVQATDDA
jgi:hypothetical protein